MAGGINAYLYVFQNPNVGADPTGLVCGLGHCVAIALMAARVALAIWSAFTTYEILEDDCISTREKIKRVALGAVFSPLKRVGKVGTTTRVPATTTATAITKNSVIEGFKVGNHAWRKSGLGRRATEELVSGTIQGARAAGTIVKEVGTGKFAGNTIEVFTHNGIKVVTDTTRGIIMSIRPLKGFKLSE